MLVLALVVWLLLFIERTPLFMGLIVLGVTISVAVLVSLNVTTWGGVVMVVVVGGGVLVLYAYFISLSSKMNMGVSPWVLMGLVVCFATTWWLPQDWVLLNALGVSNFSALSCTVNSGLGLGLFSGLFFTMVVVTKIVKQESGPMRGV